MSALLTITTELDSDDLRHWNKALEAIEARARHWLVTNGGELNRQCAISYAGKVMVAIESEQYGPYHAYTDRYAEWKTRVGLGGAGYWRLRGDLLRALTYFREDDGWKGGIPADVLDMGGKSWLGQLDRGPIKPIAMYGITMEFGGDYGRGGYHHKRPVFVPVYEVFANTMLDIYHGKMLTDLETYWR